MLSRFHNLILILSFLLISCSTTRPGGKTEAEVLYKEAKSLVEDERYLLAIEKLNTIRSKFPYSYYATHAELLNADVLFSQGNFAEAAAAYIVFKDFHPKSKKLAYVIWRIGESFYNQLPSTFDRDLSTGLEAIKYYEELIRFYPSSEYINEAKEKIVYCKKQIEYKERYIADFYFKTKNYDSAIYRYLGILKDFGDKKLRDHAMVRIVYSSAYLEDKKKCLNYYEKFKEKIKNENLTSELEEALEACQDLD